MPSSGLSLKPAPAWTIAATCTPGRPSVVSGLVSATAVPARTPVRSLIAGPSMGGGGSTTAAGSSSGAGPWGIDHGFGFRRKLGPGLRRGDGTAASRRIDRRLGAALPAPLRSLDWRFLGR